ncbi:MAG: hypothetical protein Q8M76_13750, partial [Spirochaetaceae bacterium]|nr:hypothetical protein [Spirochaetaceae bacterium]
AALAGAALADAALAIPASGTSAPRERVDASARKDAGATKLALELDLSFEPAGNAAQASGSLRFSVGAARGFSAAIEYPANIALGGSDPAPELGGLGFEFRWADRAGGIGIDVSVALDLPPPGARFGSRVGVGIVSDPVAAEAWISASSRLPLDRRALAPPALRAGLSLAHALNGIVSTALAAEIGASEGAADPRVGMIFDGGAAASVSAAFKEWGASASISLSFPYARSSFSLWFRRTLGRVTLARSIQGGSTDD